MLALCLCRPVPAGVGSVVILLNLGKCGRRANIELTQANTEPTQSQHRANTEPTQGKHKANTETTQSQHRANTEPTQANTEPTQSQDRPTQSQHRANTEPTQSQHRDNTEHRANTDSSQAWKVLPHTISHKVVKVISKSVIFP